MLDFGVLSKLEVDATLSLAVHTLLSYVAVRCFCALVLSCQRRVVRTRFPYYARTRGWRESVKLTVLATRFPALCRQGRESATGLVEVVVGAAFFVLCLAALDFLLSSLITFPIRYYGLAHESVGVDMLGGFLVGAWTFAAGIHYAVRPPRRSRDAAVTFDAMRGRSPVRWIVNARLQYYWSGRASVATVPVLSAGILPSAVCFLLATTGTAPLNPAVKLPAWSPGSTKLWLAMLAAVAVPVAVDGLSRRHAPSAVLAKLNRLDFTAKYPRPTTPVSWFGGIPLPGEVYRKQLLDLANQIRRLPRSAYGPGLLQRHSTPLAQYYAEVTAVCRSYVINVHSLRQKPHPRLVMLLDDFRAVLVGPAAGSAYGRLHDGAKSCAELFSVSLPAYPPPSLAGKVKSILSGGLIVTEQFLKVLVVAAVIFILSYLVAWRRVPIETVLNNLPWG
jgi:hypothetical protein